ncbi:unnamed protein product [Brachionus calyciflorus]|uniref:Uncharacterized protein n=1 Tax=Brachionus calyciflorus TaxID=104777 RepID=A0A813NH74_9BILA|nr:unnamed protein product [Brachionus calyciflorus]
MTQGDGSQYPILPISLSIMTICFLISLVISTIADYLYDFYLVKFAKTDQKLLIENRVKSDIKRLGQFFQSQKLEKFDPDQAKNRLTIITHLFMERINSNENRLMIPKIDSKEKEKISEKSANESVKKIEEKNKEKDEKTFVNKAKEKTPIEKKTDTILIKNEKTEKIEKKVVILDSKSESHIKEEIKKEKRNMADSQTQTPITKVQEIPKPKPISYENKGERVILAKETTIDEVIKKLSLAPRSATVLIEFRENKVRESSAKENRGSVIKFSPPSTISDINESESKYVVDNIKTNNNENKNNHNHGNLIDFRKNNESNDPKQNGDLMEMLQRSSSFSQNLRKPYKENQSKMIKERLKQDADFRKTRHTPPNRKKFEANEHYKYDNEDEYQSQSVPSKQVFE